MATIRRIIEKYWLLLLLFTFLCLGVSKIFRPPLYSNEEKPTTYEMTSYRPSTKSLNELEGRNDELSDHVLFFNRIPKTGSEMLVLLLQWMQGENGFRHIRLHGGKRRNLLLSEQVYSKVFRTNLYTDETSKFQTFSILGK